MLGDVIMAEPGALIGFAGPRVVKETIGKDLPEGFQTAEFVLKSPTQRRNRRRSDKRIGKVPESPVRFRTLKNSQIAAKPAISRASVIALLKE